jgi:hypothetical protein
MSDISERNFEETIERTLLQFGLDAFERAKREKCGPAIY